MAREVALIVNPSAGGGRAARALPGRRGPPARPRASASRSTPPATSTTRASSPSAAAQRGRVVVTLSGDGMLGAVAGALRDVPGAVVGVLPGGRGNDFARVVGIPLDAEAACDVIADGVARPIDLGLAGEHPYIGIASVGFDSEANRIANAAPARLGQLVYLYGALRALATWKHAELHRRGRRRAHRSSRAGASPPPTRRPTAAACSSRPTPSSTTAPSTSSTASARARRPSCASCCPRCSRASTSTSRASTCCAAPRCASTPTGPFMVYADGDPVGELPMTFRALPAALQVLLPA